MNMDIFAVVFVELKGSPILMLEKGCLTYRTYCSKILVQGMVFKLHYFHITELILINFCKSTFRRNAVHLPKTTLQRTNEARFRLLMIGYDYLNSINQVMRTRRFWTNRILNV